MKRSLFAAALVSVACFSTDQAAAQVNENEPEDIPVVVVTGKPPGPPLWAIKNGENTLWLFADLNIVPENMSWDSNRIARILSEAGVFVSAPTANSLRISDWLFGGAEELERAVFEVDRITQDGTLDNIIDPELYQRLGRTVSPDVLSDLIRYKPWAVEAQLQTYWMKHEGFSDNGEVIRELHRLRRKYRVPEVEHVMEVDVEERVALLERHIPLPDEFGTACLESMIEFYENKDDVLAEISAWFRGDVPASTMLHPRQVCDRDNPWPMLRLAGLSRKTQEVDALWISNLEQALANNKVSFAVVPASVLLDDSNSLVRAWLAEKNFDIRQPKYDD